MMGNPPGQFGLYDARFEHDACGVGFVAAISGEPTHDIVHHGITGLVNLAHRGAVSADGLSGDGAGMLTQIPRRFFAKTLADARIKLDCIDDLAVGVVFLPLADAVTRERCVKLIEQQIVRSGLRLLGWRQVPIDRGALGREAASTCPDIRHVLVARPADLDADGFERRLYLARKRIESAARTERVGPVYLPSLSSRVIVYKGLMVAPQLASFYPDLADPLYESAISVFHQRFSTNTFPNWRLAQPFRFLSHNGEINTIQGNINRFQACVPSLKSEIWGRDIADLMPTIEEGCSDSGALDNVFELLVLSGRDPLHAMMMLVPEAYQQMSEMPADMGAFFEYHAALMAPWDGPAALAFTDGRIAAAALDRNGLRPLRYWITADDLVVVASETGLTDIPYTSVVESGRLGPGKLFAVDTVNKCVLYDNAIKTAAALRRPYRKWVEANMIRHAYEPVGDVTQRLTVQVSDLTRMQKAFAYGSEDVERILEPIVYTGKEPVGSMGDDTPIAVLSSQPKTVYRYFKQVFAQVTNPPIDSLRERCVMSRRIALGWRHSVLGESEDATSLVKFNSPVVTTREFEWLLGLDDARFRYGTVQCVFRVSDGPEALEPAIERICHDAEALVDAGRTLIVLSDRLVASDWAHVPMMLATAAVHHHLTRVGKRMRCSLICDTGDVRDAHHFACLFGYGAALIHPYLALTGIADIVTRDPRGTGVTLEEAVTNYRTGMEDGVLKIMAKRGISTINAYRGAQVFEAIGISKEVTDAYFTGTVSRIGGVNLETIAADVLKFHAEAYGEDITLADRGIYHYRKGGEYHAANPTINKVLHKAVRERSREDYERYERLTDDRPPCHLRDLLDWKRAEKPVPLEEVESVSEIVQRFSTQAMSLGAISPETHEVLAVAMNRLGGRSNSGEGGEDPARYYADTGGSNYPRLSLWRPEPGDFGNSAIKQVASGRFGVTPEYLVSAEELEIKMAQGAKPGEGGQISGGKVSEYIAKLRNSLPGAPLISPPPHHDIYSIEDLGQLIYDLRRINPTARVGVKLVSVAGVGTIAAGVVKAYADCIQISGFDGGTGASPLSSIKHAGLPWELGLAEIQQTLVLNDLRGRVTVRVDGGMRTGRDVIMGALLGADEYGFGTAALIAAGCVMVRQCHLNTCPVGIATQRSDLRRKFPGHPDHVIALMVFIAEQVRLSLAQMGFRNLEDIIGRVDLLHARTDVVLPKAPKIDLSAMLTDPDPKRKKPRRRVQHRNERPQSDTPLDEIVWRECMPAVVNRNPIVRRFQITNRDRSVGARLSGEIARHTRSQGLPSGSIDLRFNGIAGQSFGAFTNRGMSLTLEGEAQDGVGKGMYGGTIVIKSPNSKRANKLTDPVVMGNAVMYGATGGMLFAAGRAGERFCVRNSGGWAVVEGCGDHGCEYMTNGLVAILGDTGRNFGAGMTGGAAYLYESRGPEDWRYNEGAVRIEALDDATDVQLLRALIERHQRLTGSPRAAAILDDWDRAQHLFCVAVPESNDDAWFARLQEMKLAALAELQEDKRVSQAG
ncbi:MAG: glutamate synthase large subunit [Phycisphaerales bacterium]|nr:glutamate synthase large subunit [Phycisphaerales bacterium]